MKHEFKRRVSLLLIVALVLAMLPMAISAETTTNKLYLKPNANWLMDGTRFAAYFFTNDGNIWEDAILVDADQSIYGVTIPEGYESATVIFCRMSGSDSANSWDNKWNQTGDLAIPTDGTNLFTVNEGEWDCGQNGVWSTYAPATDDGATDSTEDVTEPVTEPTEPYEPTEPAGSSSYVVAGSPDLCGDGNTGYGWDPTDLNNLMTDNGDGTYSKVYYDVAVGEDYQLKVVENLADGTSYWYGNGDNNITFNVTSVCDVTVTIDAATKEITVTGDGVTWNTFEVESIRVAGNGDECWLNGANWDPADDANLMTEIAPGVYSITYTNVTCFDNYQFKFVADGSWAYNWGGIYEDSGVVSVAELNSDNNITVVVPYELANVTLTLDLSAYDDDSKTGATFTVTVEEVKAEEPGADDIKWQVSADFTAESTSTDLRLITWVDSLDYASVTFTVTIGDVTREVSCSKVYTAINAGGVSLTAADIFGEEATYLATYTITDLPADEFTGEISVFITWTDLEGNVSTSDIRTFSIL